MPVRRICVIVAFHTHVLHMHALGLGLSIFSDDFGVM